MNVSSGVSLSYLLRLELLNVIHVEAGGIERYLGQVEGDCRERLLLLVLWLILHLLSINLF
jgi:hypothetical protein